MSSEDVRNVAQSVLRAVSKCSHCREMAAVEFIGDGPISAQVCPGRYVSRIITYGKKLDLEQFKRFVRENTPGMSIVEDPDARVSSRYAWDLGLNKADNELILREAYWTQSYRRTKNDNPNHLALFLCSNKDRFFVEPLNSNQKLCQNCRK
jgi:hypothetical protein